MSCPATNAERSRKKSRATVPRMNDSDRIFVDSGHATLSSSSMEVVLSSGPQLSIVNTCTSALSVGTDAKAADSELAPIKAAAWLNAPGAAIDPASSGRGILCEGSLACSEGVPELGPGSGSAKAAGTAMDLSME